MADWAVGSDGPPRASGGRRKASAGSISGTIPNCFEGGRGGWGVEEEDDGAGPGGSGGASEEGVGSRGFVHVTSEVTVFQKYQAGHQYQDGKNVKV